MTQVHRNPSQKTVLKVLRQQHQPILVQALIMFPFKNISRGGCYEPGALLLLDQSKT